MLRIPRSCAHGSLGFCWMRSAAVLFILFTASPMIRCRGQRRPEAAGSFEKLQGPGQAKDSLRRAPDAS